MVGELLCRIPKGIESGQARRHAVETGQVESQKELKVQNVGK